MLQWRKYHELRNQDSWRHVIAAHLRLCEFINVSPLRVEKPLRTGKDEHVVAQFSSQQSSRSWEVLQANAQEALEKLQQEFAQAAEQSASRKDKEALWAWHSKIPDFNGQEIPEELRARIPKCKGFSKLPFPRPHSAEATEWLPLKEPQPKFFRQVTGIKDLLHGKALAIYLGVQEQQRQWVLGQAERPHMKAISELDVPEWPQSRVLDLRKLKDGVITELDYAAPIASKFNLRAVAEAFQDYIDQEAISFWVLGVSFKAELPHQMVFNRHLLSLEGFHEQVFQDKAALAEKPLQWVGLFSDAPFCPARFNGNGQVPKGQGIRPTDEGGGPRTPSLDSRRVRVLSMNQYIDGEDLWIDVPGAQVEKRKEDAKQKWVAERKPRVKHVRQANAIIKEAADLCNLDVFVFRLDWFKMFNQFGLRPEDWWKSCHCYPQGFIANYCLTFGLSCASNIAQRVANAFVWLFLKEFQELDAQFLVELRARYPRFDKWCECRGKAEVALLWMCCYTDDPLWVVAGADRVVRAVKLYHSLAEKLGFLPTSFDKFSIGISTVWIGITQHVFFGLTEIPMEKAAKSVLQITKALNGGEDSQSAIKLLRLLEHCRGALALKGHSIYVLWKAIDRSEAATECTLQGAARMVAEQMITFLSTNRRSALVDLVEHLPPAPSSLALSIFSDAAL